MKMLKNLARIHGVVDTLIGIIVLYTDPSNCINQFVQGLLCLDPVSVVHGLHLGLGLYSLSTLVNDDDKLPL